MANLEFNYIFIALICIFSIILVLMVTRKVVEKKLRVVPKGFGRLSSVLFVTLSLLLLLVGFWLDSTFQKNGREEYFEMSLHMGKLFANELKSDNHEYFNEKSQMEDDKFTRILNKMYNWQKDIPEIQSVYTLKRNQNKDVYFVFAPATDYNNDGRINGEIEEQVAIGTIFTENKSETERALSGKFTLQEAPARDKWSYCITAFQPIYNQAGEVDAVLGIDFDGVKYMDQIKAERWKVLSLFIFAFVVNVMLFILSLYSHAEKILLKMHKVELNKIAYFDELTGLPNRYYLHRFLHFNYLGKNKVAFLLIGIEGLNAIDDLMGYSKGEDAFLSAVKRIQVNRSIKTMLTRWSDKDLIIILKGFLSEEEVYAIAKSITQLFSSPIRLENRDFYVSAKIGISQYPLDGSDWRKLVKKADMARAQLKKGDNETVAFFKESFLPELHEKLDLELELQEAVIKEQFVVYYQPQFDLVNDKLVGMEALVRWVHPVKGLISPLKFIPLAEELNLINTIGLFVLKVACIQIKILNEDLGTRLSVSVNLSSVQFQHPDLVESIKGILQETQFDPTLLDLEITEGSLFNFEKSSRILEDIKRLGIRISLDDFGSGYSSLGYLNKLQFDRLKIDKVFLSNIPNEDGTLMSSIVNLGHSLNLKVLAEGAETKEQVQFLKRVSCDEVQGYYFAKPLPFKELKDYLYSKLSKVT